MANIDIKLDRTEEGYWDISFVNGDFKKTDGFDTAINITLMCERRAVASEVPKPELRRGWWGNFLLLYDKFEIGSKLWLLSQARSTQETLNNSITYMEDAFRWFIDDGYLEKININAEYQELDKTKLVIRIDFIRSQNIVESKYYSVWDNTFL